MTTRSIMDCRDRAIENATSDAADQVRSMVSGVPYRLRQNWLLLMLQAFIDDSGSDLQGPVYVLSGYLGEVGQWEVFADEWDAKLRESPAIKYFKMSEAESLKWQFQGWSTEARDRKVMQLAELIGPRVEGNPECVVAQADYDTVIIPWLPHVGDRKLAKCLRDPYFFCFYQVVADCVKRLEGSHRATIVDFYFDQQGKLGNRAKSYWKDMMEFTPPQYKAYIPNEPVFRDEKLFNPLQAADLIAWQTRRRIFEVQKGVKELRPVLSVLRKIPPMMNRWNERRLREYMEGISSYGEVSQSGNG